MYQKVELSEENSLKELIKELKVTYEDIWKELNIINTSIKLPIRIILSSKDNEKIQLFEKTLNDLDLVSNFYIISFDSENILYKVIYNGSPKKFLSEIKMQDFILEKENENWRIE